MERIHVSVRARPLLAEDATSSPWRISGNSISIPNHSMPKFEFDRIFREDCTTLQVYQARTRDIVSAAIHGFNGTVFAYGQTSSGKTHTMRGSTTEPGVIPMAVQDLFNFIEEDMDREFLLRMSYMEIYNEEINDLLAPEHRKLQIHESLERGIFVAGLREEIVASPEQVLELMDFGESHRHIGETNMNVYSSRSHTIFRMIIESREKAEDTKTDAVRVSVLNLVDLAGSERAAKTGAEGVRLKEGSHINKSLMTLGTVIKKLSEGAESQGGHVPYRDSKLTRILQPALGGNANTAIICNITLAQIHADETKSSLQFASRALRVTNCVHVNEILTDAALLKRQKKEIEELRAKLQGSHSEHHEEEILNLRNTLLKSELERERIALELEEEKKAQAERERRLQEQAKKIENLSSMVLCSNWDDDRDTYKKEKRRDTWCPGNLSRVASDKLNSTAKERASVARDKRAECYIGPLLPLEELLDADSSGDFCKQYNNSRSDQFEDCTLPDPQALFHVTSRRKGASRKKAFSMEDNELLELQKEYKELLLKFESHEDNINSDIELLMEELVPEFEKSRTLVDMFIPVVEELVLFFSDISKLVPDLKYSALDSSNQIRTVIRNHEKLQSFLRQQIDAVQDEKIRLENQSLNLHNQIEKLESAIEDSGNALTEMSEKYEAEKSEHLFQIQTLQKELSYLTSSSLAREKESIRKELEKTKAKLRETESKLRSAIQEKTKLEGEKACADREIKRLNDQRAILERDINKQESVIGRRHDSVVDRSSNVFDSRRTKSSSVSAEQAMQEYKKLEMLAYEMETTIASLEEELAISRAGEAAISRAEYLESELQALSDELNMLKEEVSCLRLCSEESESRCHNLECSINYLVEEKEDLAMQLTDALLAIEEEKAIWFAKEKATIEAIDEKAKSYTVEITTLSKTMTEVTNELQSCREQCKLLEEMGVTAENKQLLDKSSSEEKSLEIDQLRLDLRLAQEQSKRSKEDEVEKAKLRMRLHWAQAKLDAFRVRYKEVIDEKEFMHKKFEAASSNLKDKIISSGHEILSLKRQLASATAMAP